MIPSTSSRYGVVPLAGTPSTALTTLVGRILAGYGLTATSAPLDIVRAFQDWTARHLIHPADHLSVNTPTGVANEHLPAGSSRLAMFNALAARGAGGAPSDDAYWSPLSVDGVTTLVGLLGAGLDGTDGAGNAAGLMDAVNLSLGWFRIRSYATYHWVLCSYQHTALTALCWAVGIPSYITRTIGHDPCCAFVGRTPQTPTGWVAIDSTYNATYGVVGDASRVLAPAELMAYQQAGRGSEVVASRVLVTATGITKPSYAGREWISTADNVRNTYWGDNPSAYRQLAVLRPTPGRPARWLAVDSSAARNGFTHTVRGVSVAVPSFPLTQYEFVSADAAFQPMGVVAMVVRRGVTADVRLSGGPLGSVYERLMPGTGQAWTRATPLHTIGVGTGAISYRYTAPGGATSVPTTVVV